MKSKLRPQFKRYIDLFPGIIELVKDAETLRKIQTEYGVTGSFQDRPIAEWLAKQNPSQLEYQRAVDNFTGKDPSLNPNALGVLN